MRVGLAQYGSSADTAANLAQAVEVAREAGRRGVELLVFHEVYMYRRPPDAAGPPAEVAEPLDGPFVRGVRRAAAENRLHLVMGLLERAPGQSHRAYNTALLVGPSGESLAVYRKVHLYDAFDGRESESFVPGDAPPPVVNTPLGRIGLQVCYDLRFPEWSRLLALQGAEYLVVPTRWVPGPLKEEHWMTLVRARAIENTCWVIACGDIPPYRLGRSVVVDPMGVVVADGGEEPGLITVEVDPERVRRVRDKNPSLQFRRPDLYGPLAENPVAAAKRER